METITILIVSSNYTIRHPNKNKNRGPTTSVAHGPWYIDWLWEDVGYRDAPTVCYSPFLFRKTVQTSTVIVLT